MINEAERRKSRHIFWFPNLGVPTAITIYICCLRVNWKLFENKVYAGLSRSLSKIYLPPAGAGAILRWPVPLHLLTLNEVSRHKHITGGGGYTGPPIQPQHCCRQLEVSPPVCPSEIEIIFKTVTTDTLLSVTHMCQCHCVCQQGGWRIIKLQKPGSSV